MSAVFSGYWITYVVILALVIFLTIFAATLPLKTRDVLHSCQNTNDMWRARKIKFLNVAEIHAPLQR